MRRTVYFAVALVLTGASSRAEQRSRPGVTIEQHHPHDFTFTAQVTGNPFDVQMSGEFSGPSRQRLVVPAFYDGDNNWKIRFAPTVTGRWSMRTVSTIAALNGKTEPNILAVANTNPQIHGALRIDPVNRHHFIFEDGTRYFLMGYEADWLWGADMKDPERRVMHHLIDQMTARGFNHVLVNVYAHDTSWAKGRTNQWDYGPPALYVFGGTNETPDHSQLNPAFFQIYDGMMQALEEKGIVVNLMFKVYNKMVNWPAPGSKEEERYFRYVTARYQAFPNVTWDFSKESFNEPDKNLQKRLIDLIRATDAYHRLTTSHDNDVYDWDPKLNSNLDFRTDQEHQHWIETLGFDRNLRRWPNINSELYYERGVDDLPTYPVKQDWQLMVRGAYEVYLSGGYFVYYYSNTAWDLVKPDPEPPGMPRFQILKENLSSLPYWQMEPEPQLAIGGPCLAIPGEVYAFYVSPATGSNSAGRGGRGGGAARSGEITVNLTALRRQATAQWTNTWTGEHVEQKILGLGVYLLTRPTSFGSAPALLIVKADGR
ncbi:MAG: hypothetical protein PVSMB7_25190 [Chloroflexota bacterium]